MTNAVEFLKKVRVSDLLPQKQNVLVIESTAKLEEALTHGCTSAPVFNRKEGKFTGLFSAMDVVAALLTHVDGDDSAKKRSSYLQFLDAKAKTFISTPVAEIVGQSHPGPFPFFPLTLAPDTRLSVLFERVFAQGIHRVAVADAVDSISHILTQSHAVSWMAKHMEQLGSRVNESLKDLKLVSDKPLIVVQENDTALDAFKTLLNAKVQGLPVVNVEGCVTGSLSSTDLKGLTEDNFRCLVEPVRIMMMELRAKQGLEPVIPVVVTPSSSLREVMELVVSCRLHRIFVVDELQRPVGIVTLTNIIEALLAK